MEFLLHNGGVEVFLADVNLEWSAQFAIGSVDEGNSDALVDRDATVASGNVAYGLLVLVAHLITVTRDSLVVEFQAHELLGSTLSLLLSTHVLTNEVFLVELHKEAKACHDGSDLRGELIAIERQTHLKAQGVAAAQSAWLNASSHEHVPHVADGVVACIHLEAVLAGVTSAAHDDVVAIVINHLEGIECQVGAVEFENIHHGLLGLGTLHCYLSVALALVLDFHVKLSSLLVDPSHVLVDVGSIDNEEVVVLAHGVNQEVVDGATVGVKHHAILDAAHSHLGDVVGEDIVHKLLRLGASNVHFAHVRDVEDANCVAHCIVFLYYAGILDGHVKTAKGAHQGTQGNVLVVQTSEFVFTHNSCL